MNLLRLSVSKTTLKIEKTELTVEKCVNYDRVAFTFDESWADLVRTATFWRGSKAADVYQITSRSTSSSKAARPASIRSMKKPKPAASKATRAIRAKKVTPARRSPMRISPRNSSPH